MKITICAAVLVSASLICGCASQRGAMSAASPEPAAEPSSVVREVVTLRHWTPAMTKWFLDQGEGTKARVAVDESGDTLILEGTAEEVQEVREIVMQIDRPC